MIGKAKFLTDNGKRIRFKVRIDPDNSVQLYIRSKSGIPLIRYWSDHGHFNDLGNSLSYLAEVTDSVTGCSDIVRYS